MPYPPQSQPPWNHLQCIGHQHQVLRYIDCSHNLPSLWLGNQGRPHNTSFSQSIYSYSYSPMQWSLVWYLTNYLEGLFPKDVIFFPQPASCPIESISSNVNLNISQWTGVFSAPAWTPCSSWHCEEARAAAKRQWDGANCQGLGSSYWWHQMESEIIMIKTFYPLTRNSTQCRY